MTSAPSRKRELHMPTTLATERMAPPAAFGMPMMVFMSPRLVISEFGIGSPNSDVVSALDAAVDPGVARPCSRFGNQFCDCEVPEPAACAAAAAAWADCPAGLVVDGGCWNGDSFVADDADPA